MARSPNAVEHLERSKAARRPRRAARLFRALAAGILVLASAGPAHSQSGLPVPRFVSLRASEVNLRTGPGTNYPVEWVYVRRHMPVEIIAEYDTWRKIRDWQGTVGWVHQSLLDGERTALIIGAVQELRRRPEAEASTVARLEPGVIVRLRECRPGWCRAAVKDYEGWLPRDAFWGLYPGETFD